MSRGLPFLNALTKIVRKLCSMAASPTMSHLSSYKSVASDEIELNDNPQSQIHHSTRHIRAHTYQNCCNHAKTLWINTWKGLKAVPWQRVAQRCFSHILPILTISWLIVLLAKMSQWEWFGSYYSVCKPDGTFELSFDDYTPWKRDAFFAINMSYGSYSFGMAKLIDVVWDVSVGRGGQALLALITYHIFTEALTRTMESSSVSTETFKALTLQNDTIFGVLRLMRDFLKVGGTRAKVAMLCTILSALFVLLVPTWLSAMTGYTADIEGFVGDSNKNLARVAEFHPVVYTIHDGDRIGFTKDYHVAVPWSAGKIYLSSLGSYSCPAAAYIDLSYTQEGYTYEVYLEEERDATCLLLWRISEYTAVSGFLGLNLTETEFTFPNGTNITVPKPSLNISAHFALSPRDLDRGPSSWDLYPWYMEPYGVGWQRDDTNEFPFHSAPDPLFYHRTSGTLYNLTQFNDNGSCQQRNDVRYKWGFSFLLLYTFVVTWLVWTIVMYGLYIDSYLHSRLDVVKRGMGLDRAVLDLSSAMQKKVDSQDLQLQGDRQLHHLVKGGHMSYQDLLLGTLPPTRWTQLQRWWRGLKYRFCTQLPSWWHEFLEFVKGRRF